MARTALGLNESKIESNLNLTDAALSLREKAQAANENPFLVTLQFRTDQSH